MAARAVATQPQAGRVLLIFSLYQTPRAFWGGRYVGFWGGIATALANLFLIFRKRSLNSFFNPSLRMRRSKTQGGKLNGCKSRTWRKLIPSGDSILISQTPASSIDRRKNSPVWPPKEQPHSARCNSSLR